MSRTVPSTTGSTVVEPVTADVRLALTPSDVPASTLNHARTRPTGSVRSACTRKLNRNALLSGLFVLLVAAGCSSPPTDPVAATSEIETASVEITPGELLTPSGFSAQLTAIVRDAQGETLSDEVEWSTIDPAVAIVDSDGTVWSFKSGSTSATATFPGKSGSSGGNGYGRAKKDAEIEVVEDTPDRPGQVADLSVDGTSTSSATLTFIEVDDGLGGAADYVVRFQVAPLSWGSASSVTAGSCSAPLHGRGAGTAVSCTVENLAAETAYQLQVVAIRTTDGVHGDLSNVASGTTDGTQSEPAPEPAPEVEPEPDPEPVPPPSGTRANQPDSYQVISSRSFDQIGEGDWTDNTSDSDYSVGVTETGSASDLVARARYRAGTTGGGAPIGTGTALNFGDRSELYVEFWVKFSDNFQGHNSGVNKVLFITDKSYGGGGDPAFIAAYGANASTLTLQVRLQGPGSEQSASIGSANLKPNLGSGSIQRGQWHRVELVLVMNTGTNHDGEAHAWLDGNKVIEYRDVRYEDASGSDHRFDNVRWNPTWGGIDDVVENDMYMWMDDIYVSGI